MNFKTLETINKEIPLEGKKILLRADLNVPVQDGKVSDTTRIDRLKPTIDTLTRKGARVILLSHFGRPKGEAKEEYSLSFLPPVLKAQWGQEVSFAAECTGPEAEKAVSNLQNGDILLLENVRFHKGEETNDVAFAKALAKLGDIYVNDAFSASHRAHASTEGLAHLLPCAAGHLMETELGALQNALESPKKPVAAIVGGAKISSKLSVLNNLVQKVDFLILGGGMANTFLFARGAEVGASLCEKDMAAEARNIMEKAQNKGCEIILPTDRIIVDTIEEGAPYEIVSLADMPEDKEAIDIGPETIRHIGEILQTCKTVLWNGPMGVFEVKPFDKGTNEVAKIAANLTKSGQVLSVAGGGDTVSALANAHVLEDFSYVSSAGGAFLEWLEGKTLPGVAALSAHARAA
ncbi:MAG: phosphoglycerate kinase [Rhodospirillales bacterium]|nr:phosphoglycerate kinase [Alphaproteobacteria bacterium]USO03117.1 MAG: phosphoglycerate kinase [Rhodospirillales bacterium]